jgi:hypothetical protein
MQPLSDDEARTFRRDYPIPASVLFAAALDRRSYWWTPPGSFHGSGALWLGPDGNGAGGWWVLARCDDAGAARRVADWLRRRMLALSTQSEGMHIVEHVLLRPRSDVRATPTTGMEFRVTVVLPNWTARMRPPTFRNYARQVFTAQSPAHLLIDQVWLGPIEMARFEGAYSAWMRALRAWSRAQQDQRSALAEVLDRTSADLRVWTMLAGSQGEAGAG